MGIKVTAGYGHAFDLEKAPHLLVAGATGSGKSSWINWMLCGLIEAYTPDDIGFVMIDPKRVELAAYKGIRHQVFDPVYDITDSLQALTWVSREMETRFEDMEQAGIRSLSAWNDSGRANRSRIVVVIDELANLVLADKKAEKKIVRLAAMGRAAGIHLVLATQRPSADVLTGLIRANVPTRICMPVGTEMESRIVLDSNGAEHLSVGEALCKLPGSRSLQTVKFPHLTDEEIDSATSPWK